MEKHKHELLPFLWSGWDEDGDFLITFYDVEFTEDFGRIKKGATGNVQLDYQNGIVELIDIDENVVSQKYKLVPVEE